MGYKNKGLFRDHYRRGGRKSGWHAKARKQCLLITAHELSDCKSTHTACAKLSQMKSQHGEGIWAQNQALATELLAIVSC